jgi:glycyl-tRNA synthetase beta chain
MSRADRRDLLVELFVEELPPKALKRLGEAFAAGAGRRLEEARPGLGRFGGDVVRDAAPPRAAPDRVAARAADQEVVPS